MKKLRVVQKHNALNVVYVRDEAHPISNGHHNYGIQLGTKDEPTPYVEIQFQSGPRNVLGFNKE